MYNKENEVTSDIKAGIKKNIKEIRILSKKVDKYNNELKNLDSTCTNENNEYDSDCYEQKYQVLISKNYLCLRGIKKLHKNIYELVIKERDLHYHRETIKQMKQEEEYDKNREVRRYGGGEIIIGNDGALHYIKAGLCEHIETLNKIRIKSDKELDKEIDEEIKNTIALQNSLKGKLSTNCLTRKIELLRELKENNNG